MSEMLVAFEPGSRLRGRGRSAPKAVRSYPARVARQLGLAHALQQRIDGGESSNQAALARALGFSRERISNVLDLLLLAPDIQEEILFLECPPGAQPLSEADLHASILRTPDWGEQRSA